ncbi:amino acid ABC transporter permease [Roseinatronobacter alkalisoli]|uniref:Amino acid ABC transporter permease n=1 Tax=Roseinatronobacter alkalisoli TaxID=3028235 RepID=A0ABT5TBU4_9RHOB|nr:amino acid ABC transporter permease [Roseinatronobacter sp. HJB301]MDD7972471.1 amino acid ABC transporter permease [Roseinatronobacter sp. HJB301]
MDLRFFEIFRNVDYVRLLFEGAALSAGLTLAAGIIGFVIAIVLSFLRHRRVFGIHWVAATYVEFIRNTPLIVQLFFVAFGLPLLLGYQWPFWAHALLALVLNFSAYFAEILRAGFNTVGNGQDEAAQAMGLKPFIIFLKITLPQAIGKMFPSLSSQFIFLFLTTGIISEIGVRDLTNAGIFIDSRTFRTFEVFVTLTVIYIAISLSFKGLMVGLYRLLFPWVGLQR